MRRISQKGINLIKSFEGFVPHVYVCPAGCKTIGYGHVLRSGEMLETLSEHQAENLLRYDVVRFERAVGRLIRVPLSQNQYDALVSFAFNLGAGALQRSSLRRKVNREQHDDVPLEFLKWCKAGGRILPGLLRRREAEARMYGG